MKLIFLIKLFIAALDWNDENGHVLCDFLKYMNHSNIYHSKKVSLNIIDIFCFKK